MFTALHRILIRRFLFFFVIRSGLGYNMGWFKRIPTGFRWEITGRLLIVNQGIVGWSPTGVRLFFLTITVHGVVKFLIDALNSKIRAIEVI